MFDDRVAALDALARDRGLDVFPVSLEVVPHESMTAVAAYDLPTRVRH
jgi:spore cortex formation protein SpoVR/YcgB (stage V sporulation)